MRRVVDDETSGAPPRSARPARARLARAFVVACVLPLTSAWAQKDDVPQPPRIDRAAEAPRGSPAPRAADGARAGSRGELLLEVRPEDLRAADALPLPSVPDTSVRPPNAARLAPLPEERRPPSGVEEIIVLGGGDWRLPDLGSRWRARQEAADEAGVPHLTLLPLYDPEHPTTFNNTFLLNREVERIGYIDLFRLHFGKRAKADREE
jgi:hypothetical protein